MWSDRSTRNKTRLEVVIRKDEVKPRWVGGGGGGGWVGGVKRGGEREKRVFRIKN